MNSSTGEHIQAEDPTAAVISMDCHEVDELLALLVSMDIEIARPPRAGLVMMKVTDSLATDFYVGEVLVTEAEVTLNGQRGYGMIIGEEPRKALARAATNALLRGGQPEVLCRQVRECLAQAHQRQSEKNAADAALVASTRVSFDLMAGA